MNPEAELAALGLDRFTACDHGVGEVTHLVLFRYTSDTTDAERAEIARRFHALASSERDGEPYILGITSGEQNGAEGDGRFDRAFVVRFASLGDRNYYVGEPVIQEGFDPVHAAFKEFVGPHLDDVLVFDFQSVG